LKAEGYFELSALLELPPRQGPGGKPHGRQRRAGRRPRYEPSRQRNKRHNVQHYNKPTWAHEPRRYNPFLNIQLEAELNQNSKSISGEQQLQSKQRRRSARASNLKALGRPRRGLKINLFFFQQVYKQVFPLHTWIRLKTKRFGR
jgi:hypothetical protein